MLTLYYGPGACSMASHIVLEESGEKYQPKRMDLAKGEQRSEAYLKMNPQGRVPCLQLDNGEPLAENTAILPYLGKRFKKWPTDPAAEAKALSLIGFFAASVHPAHAPGVEHEGVRIEHRILVADPLAARELLVDLLEMAVEGLQPLRPDAGQRRLLFRIALRPPDMGMRRVHAGGKEADQRQRLGLSHRIGRP